MPKQKSQPLTLNLKLAQNIIIAVRIIKSAKLNLLLMFPEQYFIPETRYITVIIIINVIL